MVKQHIPMTIQGELTLRKELKDLKSSRRPKIISAIAEAREHGDLKENAEYHAAREQQSFVEGRIKVLEAKLSRAHIIDVTKIVNTGRVVFGATITLLNLETGKKITYQIVGEEEADIKEGKISVVSPLARALVGKRKNDTLEVETPSGIIDYKIVLVDYL